MNKDTPVICIESGAVLDWKMCPKSLALEDLSVDKIYKWLSNRALPLSRKNADKIYQVMGLPREDYLGLMYITHSLSITDNFWIAEDKEIGKIKYSDINIFDNSFSQAMYLVALRGADGFSIQEKIISPEFTGQGTYPKCFIRESSEIFLCKNQTMKEIQNEVIAGHIAEVVNLRSALYSYRRVYDLDCSVSKIISSKNTNWETAFDITEAMERLTGQIPQDFAANRFKNAYTDLAIFDGIILNDDRHMKNWAFETDGETNNLIGIAPSYDYNKAFKATGETMSQLIFDGFKRINILRAAREAYRMFGTNLDIYGLAANIENLPDVINKRALENRINYILGYRNSANGCY